MNFNFIIGICFAFLMPIVTIAPVYLETGESYFLSVFCWFLFASWIVVLHEERGEVEK